MRYFALSIIKFVIVSEQLIASVYRVFPVEEDFDYYRPTNTDIFLYKLV
jgi:hypothetical protein